MQHIEEPARTIPVVRQVDVAVAGGGIAGVAAAVAAARNGARVLLVEREFGLGGLATLGNVIKYLPLCDGMGRQVIGGLGEELLRLSIRDTRCDNAAMGLEPIPECWNGEGAEQERIRHRFLCGFNPFSFQLAMEQLLIDEGVEILYGTWLSGSRGEAGALTHIILENKSGRFAAAARAFVDATGDADLCAVAGEKVACWNYNVRCGWHYFMVDGELRLQTYSVPFRFTDNGTGCTAPYYSGIDGGDVTRQILDSRKGVRERLAEMRRTQTGSDIQPFALPSIPSFRATRRLNNRFVLRDSDMFGHFHDLIGITGDWRRRGPVYPLPLRALQADRNRNLFAAGRCISADTDVWDVTRVIPVCAVTGEAAGLAAALTAQHCGGGRLVTTELQERLRTVGAVSDSALLLERNGVRLRNAAAGDIETLCRWWNDGGVMAHAGYPDGLGITADKVRGQLESREHRRLLLECDGKAVGEMSYRPQGDAAEIGIKICDGAYQERGIGTQALTLLIDFLFDAAGFDRIVLDTNLKNSRAQHVYEKLGFVKQRTDINSWKNQRGEPQSSVDYQLMKNEWQR